jgi:hypothetical protein
MCSWTEKVIVSGTFRPMPLHGPKPGSRERQPCRLQCMNQPSRNRSNPTSAAYCKSIMVLPSWIAPVLIICSAKNSGSSISVQIGGDPMGRSPDEWIRYMNGCW